VRDRYDLAVVGGGTGGLVSALIAAAAGARVVLAERARLGGDCLWTGCVPSKSLLAAAGLAERMRNANAVGLEPVAPRIDFAVLMAHVDAVRRRIEPQDSAERLAREGVEVVHASARFRAPGVLEAGGRVVHFRRAIIATGARPAMPAIPGLDAVAPLTSEDVWDLRSLPQRLAVLGGGSVGCELAQAFARLGAQVTLVEQAGRLLPGEEARASDLLAARLRREGIDVRVGARANAVRPGELELRGDALPGTIPFERILVATGRVPHTAGLELERAGVRTDERGAVLVDARLRTTARDVYAVGDVTAALPFTHVAAYHARVAAVNALFAGRRTVDYHAVPWVTFTDPEIARVGMTEAQARERWGRRAVATGFDYAELDRALTAGQAEGFALLVGDPRGRLVGATVAAPSAGEAIAELAAWIACGERIERVSQTVHAYPTFAEGPARAADEYLRARLRRPWMRALTRTALRAQRALARSPR
jgi:pyruvate/2-oxoglutarate dehydrogenase complex dihydrolipoamide dehydrogenase (E3) component